MKEGGRLRLLDVYPASSRGFVYVSGRMGCKNRTGRQENRLKADGAAEELPDREGKEAVRLT